MFQLVTMDGSSSILKKDLRTIHWSGLKRSYAVCTKKWIMETCFVAFEFGIWGPSSFCVPASQSVDISTILSLLFYELGHWWGRACAQIHKRTNYQFGGVPIKEQGQGLKFHMISDYWIQMLGWYGGNIIKESFTQ